MVVFSPGIDDLWNRQEMLLKNLLMKGRTKRIFFLDHRPDNIISPLFYVLLVLSHSYEGLFSNNCSNECHIFPFHDMFTVIMSYIFLISDMLVSLWHVNSLWYWTSVSHISLFHDMLVCYVPHIRFCVFEFSICRSPSPHLWHVIGPAMALIYDSIFQYS